jgi:hypothetical protein
LKEIALITHDADLKQKYPAKSGAPLLYKTLLRGYLFQWCGGLNQYWSRQTPAASLR